MTPLGRPRFEVIVATASAEERRLVSATTIRALTGIPETGDGGMADASLNLLIDGELIRCARSCNLALFRALPPTLAQESVRATWRQDCWDYTGSSGRPRIGWGEPSQLLLPWRAPITSIEIEEGGVDLVENTDFQLLGAGVVERIGGCWPTVGTIVANYVAGWIPLADDPTDQEDGETMPADLIALLGDQVRMAYDRRDIDLNLRSEDVPGIWSGSFNVAGGDAVDTGGLLRPLYDALRTYRAPATIA